MRQTTRTVPAVLVLLLVFGCSKQKPTQAEIDHQVAAEVSKIAAEKARINALTEEKREALVAELAQRTEKIEERKQALAENIAAERVRRAAIAAEIRDYVDALVIITGQVNGEPRVLIGNQIAPEGFVLVHPSGAQITYKGRDGNYFVFNYAEDAFAISLKRMTKGLSIVSWTLNKPMTDGSAIEPTVEVIPDGKGSAFTVRRDVASESVASRGFSIVSATYGAGATQRDVTAIVKQKVRDGRLETSANSGDLGGDPVFGQVKSFRVKYLSGGTLRQKEFREGDRVSLP